MGAGGLRKRADAHPLRLQSEAGRPPQGTLKLGPYHLRKDGCWREVPQDQSPKLPDDIAWRLDLMKKRSPVTVLQLLFEWPWQKKDPMLGGKP